MGGFGSGRPSGSGRDIVESCRSIDVTGLRKAGCLRAGWTGAWQSTRNGERVAWINLRTEVHRLHLSYRVRVGGGAWAGVLFCLAGLSLLPWSLISFRRSFRIGIDTDHPDELIVDGVFAFSRNPSYVAFAMVLIGEFLIFPNWISL